MAEYADVKGFVYDPPEKGLPFIGVVFSSEQIPAVKFYASRDAASSDVVERVALTRREITTDRIS